MRKQRSVGFTLVEVLIALSLSAAIFASALNLLLGIVGAWEKAQEGDLLADEEYRLYGFLQRYLEQVEAEAVTVENLPGERGEMWLTFPIEDSPLTREMSEEWRTELFALVRERDELRIVPFVEDGDTRDQAQFDDGLPFLSGEFEMTYWIWDEASGDWDELDELERRGGQDPELPQYLVLRIGDEPIRWMKIGSKRAGLALW